MESFNKSVRLVSNRGFKFSKRLKIIFRWFVFFRYSARVNDKALWLAILIQSTMDLVGINLPDNKLRKTRIGAARLSG